MYDIITIVAIADNWCIYEKSYQLANRWQRASSGKLEEMNKTFEIDWWGDSIYLHYD